MWKKRINWPAWGVFFLLLAEPAQAHDPVFGPGPHVLFKDGVELGLAWQRRERGSQKLDELELEVKYGLSGNWVVGLEIPYEFETENDQVSSGLSNVSLFSKYRFWRRDRLGVQESIAALFQFQPDSGDKEFGSGSSNFVTGLTYGFESLKWYRWASLRYRGNGNNSQGFHQGNRWLVDLALGIRPTVRDYREPDLVLMLEINGEIADRSSQNGTSLSDSGGQEWFLSPGLMWTKRNFALKTGVQVPVYRKLNGLQPGSKYHAKLELEWHF